MLIGLDTETTGLDSSKHEVWQLSLVAFCEKTRQILSEVYLHVKPDRPELFERKAMETTGLKISDFDNPIFITKQEAAKIIYDWTQSFPEGYRADKIPLVGVNLAFDEDFLKAMFAETTYKYPLSYRKLDMGPIAYFVSMLEDGEVDKNCGSLGDMANRFNIKFDAHNSRADVYASISVLFHFHDLIKAPLLEAKAHLEVSNQWLYNYASEEGLTARRMINSDFIQRLTAKFTSL
jgi:DNA polymerase III epsilon subunit-like protein